MSLTIWKIFGFVFTGLVGTLLHFLYEWSNNSVVISLFSAVNESIWEHMKLLFFPMFIFSLIEYKFIGSNYKNFWGMKLIGTVLSLCLIPIIYYTYTAVLGRNIDWFNILIFFLAVAVSFLIEVYLFKNKSDLFSSQIAFMLFCLIALVFFVLTFLTPRLPIFKDPVTGTYGI